jgi:hypothetical protein
MGDAALRTSTGSASLHRAALKAEPKKGNPMKTWQILLLAVGAYYLFIKEDEEPASTSLKPIIVIAPGTMA